MSLPVDPRSLLETTPLIPWEADAGTGHISYVGPQGRDHLGYDLDEWRRAGFWERHVFPDDQVTLREARQRMVTEGGSHVIDYRMEHESGRIVWTCEIAGTSTAEDGSRRIHGFLLNVTNRKRQELALWKSEERLRGLLRRAPDAMVLTDDDGMILNLNDQAESLFGYELSEVKGSSIDHFLPDRLRHRFPTLRASFDRDPERRSLIDGHSFAIVRRDGIEVPAELSLSLVQGDDDERQIVCVVRDLTARRRVEAQLRSSERRLRQIADVLPATVCFVDTEQRYRFVNEAFARWHGWEQHQLEGRLVREVIGEELYAHMRSSIEGALEGVASHFRGEVTDTSGRRLPVDVSIVPQHDEEGDVSGYFVVTFDVSDEAAAQEADARHRAELAHVSRVATMGELAASIAHELNQPLSAIYANAQASLHVLRASPPDMEEAIDALGDITADARRAGDVIASVRSLLQRGEAHEQPVDVLAIIGDVIELLRSESIGRGVKVHEEGSGIGLPMVHGDPIQLKQVIINLIMNAIEATAQSPAENRVVRATASVKSGEVEVSVHDTGPGLPTSDAEELFLPFVSKRAGGLGMGLAISRTIIEAHGGRLWAEPGGSGGAVFKLRLPFG